ncbi:hypothetical protein AB0E25_15645 [Streptomyces bobili]|uniref:hypothetical protein n=1 Tax=Streptomyces bobili TaxID=67280 RepID=UPI00340B7D28
MTAEGKPVPVLRVHNTGTELQELALEPYGSDHWLRPGETFVIWALGRAGEPFQVDHGPGTVTVHAESFPAHVGTPGATRSSAATDARPRPVRSG